MSVVSPPRMMTVDEFLDLPDRKLVERMLIRGELWERKVTYRNPWHSSVLAQVILLLGQWNRSQSSVRGIVVGGDAGFLISKKKDTGTIFGIDAAFVLKDTPLYRKGKRAIFDGPPLLAVEVLSPSDRQDNIEMKVDEYLVSKVALVWVISPHQRTVTVFRPDAEPELFSQSAEMSGDPHLPGLRFRVAELFAEMP